MLKWLSGIAVISLAVISVAYEQHNAREKNETQRQKDCIALSGTSEEKRACEKESQSRKDYAPWWYVLVAWPEGITTWAIVATGFVIAWQSSETRKAAEVANQNLAVVVNRDRPRLLIQPQPFTVIVNDYPAIGIKVQNIGGSKAIFGLCLVGIEATDLEEVTIPKKPVNTMMLKKLCGKILESGHVHEEMIEMFYPAEVFPPNFDKSRPYKLHIFGVLNFRDILFEDSWVREFHYVLVSTDNVYLPQFGKWSAEFWSPLMEEVDKRRVKPSLFDRRMVKLRKHWDSYNAWIDASEANQTGEDTN